MNVILLDSQDLTSNEDARLIDRRAAHIREILRLKTGEKIRVGRIGGKLGTAVITSLTETAVELKFDLDREPPQALDLTLYLALPRPKFLSRVLQTATSLGVKRIHFFNSYKVEKIYWSCEQLQPEAMRQSCLLGLEQARDTILPVIHTHRLFKPFVEDELPDLVRETLALVAHPSAKDSCPFAAAQPVSLAIGPEGGFIDYEIDKLQAAGFRPVHALERILKVETAVVSLISRLK